MRLACWLLTLLLAAAPACAVDFPASGASASVTQQRLSAMQGYVERGCLASRSGLTVTMAPCQAFALDGATPPALKGFEEVSARTWVLPSADGTVWVVGRWTPTVEPSGWTCLPGQHYCWKSSATPPPRPPGTVDLARFTVSVGTITEVGDLRPDSPERSAPVTLTSPLFGAVGDCATDDTQAMAAWYANAQWRKRPAYAPAAPGGCYKFTRWALLYDATYAPTLTQTALRYGEIEVFGDGWMDTADFPNNNYHGTVFESTDATGPAIFGDSAADFSNPFRGMTLRNFSVIGNNSTYLMSLKGYNSNCAMKEITMYQRGAGTAGGLLLEDTFLLNMERMFIMNANEAALTAAGTGITIRNATRAGGVINLDNVSARGWTAPEGTGWELGHTTYSLAKQINTINAIGIQGVKNSTGIVVAAGVAGATFQTVHIEQATVRGMLLYGASRAITILNGFFGNDAAIADLQIGLASAPTAEEESNGVSVIGTAFQGVKNIGILRQIDAEMSGFVVLGNIFTPQVHGQGVGIQCGTDAETIQRSALIGGNFFPSTSSPAKFQFQTRYCAQVELTVGSTYVRVGSGLAVTRTPDNESMDWVPPATQLMELMQFEATLDFPAIAGHDCTDLTIAAPGVATGDIVSGVAIPQVAQVAGLIYGPRIQTADSIAVRACNVLAGTSPDPGSGTFKVAVERFE